MDEDYCKRKHSLHYLEDLEITKTTLLFGKNIYLIRAFKKENQKKKYIKNLSILIDNVIYTATFADTQLFMEEINLFDRGNIQNKYMKITEFEGIKNLELQLANKRIYLSKSEAKAIYKIFNLAFAGYTVSRLLEDECILTHDILIKKGLNNDC